MSAPDNTIVHTQDLTRSFGKFVAVDRLNISVKRGEIFGFLGANGAGKTTVIRMLCGLLKPTSGAGMVAGFDIAKEAEKIKTRIGYMSQKFSLYNDLKVRENMEFFGGVYGLSDAKLTEKIQETVDKFGLITVKDKITGELPLGWKQKLALGTAIMHDPDIIFLDEATGGVDPLVRRAFWDTINELADSGKTIFVTTHYMDEAEYCHTISIMHQGRVLALGAVGDLKREHQKSSVDELFKFIVMESQGVL